MKANIPPPLYFALFLPPLSLILEKPLFFPLHDHAFRPPSTRAISKFFNYQFCTSAAGGGSTKTNILQAVDLNVFDTSVCHESYSKLLDFRFKWPQGMTPDKTLCVGWEEGGRDACKVRRNVKKCLAM